MQDYANSLATYPGELKTIMVNKVDLDILIYNER